MPTFSQTSRSRPALGARRLNNENVASGPSQPITYVKDVLSAVQSRPRQTAPGAIQATRKRVLGEKTIVHASSSSNTNNSSNNINPSASDKENGGSGGSKVSRLPSKKQPLQTHGIPMVPVRASVAAPSSASSTSSTSTHVSVTLSSNATTYVPAPGAVRKPLQERIPVANQQDKITFLQQEKPHITVKKEPGTGSKSSLHNVMHQIEYNAPRPVAIKSEPDLVKSERTAAKRPAEDSLLHGVMHKLECEADAELARDHEQEEDLKRPKREELLGWDDLDAEDEGDPLMVSEYVTDIFNYMQTLENETMPDPQYMDTQKELAWKMRSVLVDWLAEVHNKFKLLPETLFLAVNLIDRFLSSRGVSLVKLQLVGVTALFIAAKYEEVMAPSVQNFIYMTDGGFTDKEILKAERYMLQALSFKLCYPSPMNFLRRISKADNYDIHSRTVAKYLMEVPLLDHNFLPYQPSLISAAALCLARKMMGHEDWTVNLAHYSGYTEPQLLPCMELMVEVLKRPSEDTFIFKKYSTKRFMKASIFVREWIHQHLQPPAHNN
ncbi:G2/mitotic-specific cyclin [Linnemannia schmuckeri]|uniref:G2/mitotic-specific cyclin n=1 Tax=Linnemannia schmuckeri TaxID=64567 RepID=A0A9P5RRR4_9FUNG|nr:G2/mitotic-specific cyclin [Linnemannia schmuckeri]